MKINKIAITLYISVISCSLFLPSCVDDFSVGDDFLEKQPGVDVNIDTIFSKSEYAHYFLWQCYAQLYTPWSQSMNSSIFETLSDCVNSTSSWTTVPTYWYSGNYSAAYEWAGRLPFNNIWKGDGTTKGGVRQAWIFIENVDRVPDMDAAEKARLKAEAKIFIAARYFDLMRHVGGLPIIDHAYAAGEELPEGKGRGTIEETVNFMLNLLEEAKNTAELPWSLSDADYAAWSGRLTKASAVGLKAKILLFAASPLFNNDQPYCTEAPQDAVTKRQVWYGKYKQELWVQCLQACEEFFTLNSQNGNYYHLIQPTAATEDAYRSAYRQAYRNRGNSEKIIEVHGTTYKMGAWDQLPGNLAHYGALSPTLEFMEMFPWTDGKNFDPTGLYDNDNPSNINIYENRDPRLYETMVVQKEGFKWYGIQAEIWVGGRLDKAIGLPEGELAFFMPWGFPLYKWILDFQHIGDEAVQWPYLRMAEMHLIYAEALAETGNLLKACDEINKVRNRVGLPDIEMANPLLSLTSNKTNLINEILRERACELGYEDTRFFDMVRRKLESDFTKTLHKLDTYRKDGTEAPLSDGETYPSGFRYVKLPITESARAWWRSGGWSSKWLLEALPIDEVNKGYGLTQNPGW
jgi:hypothetical protein